MPLLQSLPLVSPNALASYYGVSRDPIAVRSLNLQNNRFRNLVFSRRPYRRQVDMPPKELSSNLRPKVLNLHPGDVFLTHDAKIIYQCWVYTLSGWRPVRLMGRGYNATGEQHPEYKDHELRVTLGPSIDWSYCENLRYDYEQRAVSIRSPERRSRSPTWTRSRSDSIRSSRSSDATKVQRIPEISVHPGQLLPFPGASEEQPKPLTAPDISTNPSSALNSDDNMQDIITLHNRDLSSFFANFRLALQQNPPGDSKPFLKKLEDLVQGLERTLTSLHGVYQKSIAVERNGREAAERNIQAILQECRDPFIVPSLVGAFMKWKEFTS